MGSNLWDPFQGRGGKPPQAPSKDDSAAVGSYTEWSRMPTGMEQPHSPEQKLQQLLACPDPARH